MKRPLHLINMLVSSLLACVLAFGCSSAVASTTTSEITDMWWNPNESGWGVNIIAQVTWECCARAKKPIGHARQSVQHLEPGGNRRSVQLSRQAAGR